MIMMYYPKTDYLNSILITLDTDWAPDFVLEHVANILIENNVPATWFITHDSIVLKNLKKESGLFELGIHPNFLPGSTQGDSPREVLKKCMKIVPDAVSMRSHSVYQSAPLLSIIMNETPIMIESSIFLPLMPNIRPVQYHDGEKCLFKIPFFWADDNEICHSLFDFNFFPVKLLYGVKVFTFHPIHIYLNSSTPANYEILKSDFGNTIQDITPQYISKYVKKGKGVGSFFMEIVKYLKNGNQPPCRIKDLI